MCLLLSTCAGGNSQKWTPGGTGAAGGILSEDSAGDLGWHELVLDAHDMNAALRSPSHVKVQVSPQEPADFDAKGVSSLANGFNSLPTPNELALKEHDDPRPARPDQGHSAAAFDEDLLVQDGGRFDATLPLQAVTTQADLPQGSFDSAATPGDPALADGAYATYRYELLNYAFSGQPQSIGLAWSDDDSPGACYIGLSNWGANRWDWYEVSNDNVVTVPSMYTYQTIDGLMYVLVVVLDSESRSLEFVQVGAEEVRGFGGDAPPDAEAEDYDMPELFDPDKATSASMPASWTLPYGKLGTIYNQGQSQMCGGCAASTALSFELANDYAPYWDPNRFQYILSPKWAWKQANPTPAACKRGRNEPAINDMLRDVGIATLTQAPFNVDCNDDWTGSAANEASYLRADRVFDIRSKKAKGLSEIRQVLYNLQRPVFMLITLDPAFGETDFKNGAIWTWDDDEADWTRGHYMVIYGWDDGKQAFLVRNSWGLEWGDEGDCWISYDTFSKGTYIGCHYIYEPYNQDTADYFGVASGFSVRSPDTVICDHGVANDHVHVAWTNVPAAQTYAIYRDTASNRIATVASDVNAYDDFDVSDQYAHIYWVQTLTGVDAGPIDRFDYGWLREPDSAPEILDFYGPTLQAQGSAGGYNFRCHNPNSPPLSYEWDFQPGSVTGPTHLTTRDALVTFDIPGTYSGTLKITNSFGFDELYFNYEVIASVDAPAVSYTGPDSIKIKRIAYFDASASSVTPPAEIVEFQWDMDGDGMIDLFNQDSDAAYIYQTPGDYTVRMRVRDSRGLYSAWVDHPIKLTNYDETEPNDVSGEAGPSLIELKTYKGSIGSRAGYSGYDGDTGDWWQFPYQDTTNYVKVSFDNTQISELTVKVWSDTFLTYVEDVCSDGLAEVYFPAADPAASLYVELAVTGTGGGDYSLSYDHF